MTIKDLIEQLSKFDDSMDVVCYDENKDHFLEIENISEVEGEKVRNKNGTAGLKFIKSDSSEKHLLMQVTTDF